MFSSLIASRSLTAADVGAMHTDAFRRLGELYENKSEPTKLELIADVAEIAASYCPSDDAGCVAKAYESTLKTFSAPKNVQEPKYPANYDEELKAHMETFYSALRSNKGKSLDEMVEELEDIRANIEDLENVNEEYKHASLAGVSVGIESAKLWHEVVNDPEHGLHNVNGGRRKAQSITVQLNEIDWLDIFGIPGCGFNGVINNSVVEADAVAATNTATETVEGGNQDISDISVAGIMSALPASVLAWFATTCDSDSDHD